jgi:Zn-dependent protease with chaperone function
MEQFSGELLDGTSTTAVPVTIELTEEGLSLLFSDGKTQIWPYQHICDIQQTANGFSCLRNQDSSVSDYVKHQICFTDESLFREIQKRSLATKPVLQKAYKQFWTLSVWKILLVTIILLGSFFYLFSRVLLKVYLITPCSYDIHLGNNIDSTITHVFEQCKSPELDTFLQKALKQLSQPDDKFPHRVIVLNDSTKNAISIPGGTIYLFRGLLESSSGPDEILGVLGHEISHAEKRHSVRQIFQSMGVYYMSKLFIGVAVDGFDMMQGLEETLEMSSILFTLRYSRDFEREADSLSIERLHKARLKVGPLDSLLTRITPAPRYRDRLFAIFSTHPLPKERSERFSAARQHEIFEPDTLFNIERKKWDEIKKCCSQKAAPKPFWKKILRQ